MTRDAVENGHAATVPSCLAKRQQTRAVIISEDVGIGGYQEDRRPMSTTPYISAFTLGPLGLPNSHARVPRNWVGSKHSNA